MSPDQAPAPSDNQPMTPDPTAPSPMAQPEQPQPEVQPQQPQAQATPEYTPPQTTEDPGKIFSIIGLVCAFLFLQLPGLILSIIGLRKSKKTGHSTTLAIVGICLNSITMLISAGIIAAIVMTAANGVQSRAMDSERESNAASIMKKAIVYSTENDTATYPTVDQLRSVTGNFALSDKEAADLKDTETPANDEVGYKTCEDDNGVITGAHVYTYSNADMDVKLQGMIGDCAMVME